MIHFEQLFAASGRSGDAKEANAALRSRGRKAFHKLLDSANERDLNANWTAFQKEFEAHPRWVSYIQNQHMSQWQKWAAFLRKVGEEFFGFVVTGRQSTKRARKSRSQLYPHPLSSSPRFAQGVCCGIDTNNFIESWHGHLKKEYLRFMRKQRADYLVWILATKVEPDYRQNELRYRFGILERRLTSQETKAREKAKALPLDEGIAKVDLDEVGFRYSTCTKTSH